MLGGQVARIVLALVTLSSSIGCQATAPAAPPAASSAGVATPAPIMPTTSAPPTGKTSPSPAASPTRAGPAPPITPLPLQTPQPGGLDPHFGIAEGFRDPAVMADIGAGWERVVLSWADIQPDGPDDFSWLGRTIPPPALAGELNRGVRLAGLLQFTATWAATNPDDPGRSVPRNLDLADEDPANYWGRFVYETVRYYAGRIDEWIVWNEPEFSPADAASGTGSYTWLGTDQQFARLMEVAYRAAKRANPHATVAFPGTSYWVDQNSGRPQFYERFLRLEATNPGAAAQHFFHDAVPLNLYRAPDDLVRVHQAFKTIQQRYGIDKAMWLLELNAMPTDDLTIPCADRHAHNPIQTSQAQQAAYAVQAFALAAAVGYARVGFYQMVDDNPCTQSAVWGITRDDGSARLVAGSLRTTVHALSGFLNATFAPLSRPTARWAAWPDDPGSFTPNWQVYAAVFDLPGARRVTVLWNGDGTALRLRLARHGTAQASLIDATGEAQPLTLTGADWTITLPAATAHYAGDPPGYFFIGGDARLLIEDGVAPGSPVAPPRLG